RRLAVGYLLAEVVAELLERGDLRQHGVDLLLVGGNGLVGVLQLGLPLLRELARLLGSALGRRQRGLLLGRLLGEVVARLLQRCQLRERGLDLLLVGVDRLVRALEFGQLLVERRLLLGGQLAGLLGLGAGAGERGLELGLRIGRRLLGVLDLGERGQQRGLVLVGQLVGLVQLGARGLQRRLVALALLQQLLALLFQARRLVVGVRELRVGVRQAGSQRIALA